MHILVVDDDVSVRFLIHRALQEEGFIVSTAENGVQALEIVRAEPVDMVILDLEMPLMDGRVFYRALRALPSVAPVLILSGGGARAAQRELGAEAAVAKPFLPDELAVLVRKLTQAQ
jgi:two-component system response regulator MprA